MLRTLRQRTFRLLLTMLLMSVTVFFCIRIMPGDPIRLIYGDKEVSEAVVQRTRERYDLDKPLVEQYLLYMADFLRGDLGYSYFYSGKSVVSIIGRGFSVTLTLTLLAFPLSALAGLALGLVAAAFRRRWPDRVINGLAVFLTAIPSVPMATFLVLIFSVRLRLFPISGWGTVSQAILPAVFVALFPAMNLSKMVRSLAVEELEKPYVFLCRARGMSRARILLRECLPNVMVPVTTKLGMMFGSMLEGALIAELVFNIPGLARKSLDAINRRDYPVILAVVLLSALIYTLLNYAMELLQSWLDPRIREGERLE